MRRSDIDHAPPTRLAHHRQRHSGGVKGRGKINRDDRVPFFGREALNRGDMLNACIVNKNITAPCRLNQGAALIGLGHICCNIARGDAMTFGQISRQIMVFGAVSKGIEHNIRARLRQYLSHAQPNPRV